MSGNEHQPISKMCLAIADDHSLFRKGLRALVEDFGFVGQVYEAADGIELIKLLEQVQPLPEVILMDLHMPNMDGIEATAHVLEKYPGIKIVVLTLQDSESSILQMIEMGVSGYLMKNVEPDELEKALIEIRRKEFYFTDNLSGLVMKALMGKGRKAAQPQTEKLTDRETEVLTLICEELTNSEIADRLNLSKRTIDGHRNNLYEKTGAKNMAGLVLYAVKNGIFQP